MDENYMNEASVAMQMQKKPETNYYILCKNGITRKPGIRFVAKLGKPVGESRVTCQVLDAGSKRIIASSVDEISPDMTNLQLWGNLPGKGKYIINFVTRYQVLAEGEIEFK